MEPQLLAETAGDSGLSTVLEIRDQTTYTAFTKDPSSYPSTHGRLFTTEYNYSRGSEVSSLHPCTHIYKDVNAYDFK